MMDKLFIYCLIKDGIGGSYRLASLDRLATRQRILEQNSGLGGGGVGGIEKTNGSVETNGGVLPSSVRICFIFMFYVVLRL